MVGRCSFMQLSYKLKIYLSWIRCKTTFYLVLQVFALLCLHIDEHSNSPHWIPYISIGNTCENLFVLYMVVISLIFTTCMVDLVVVLLVRPILLITCHPGYILGVIQVPSLKHVHKTQGTKGQHCCIFVSFNQYLFDKYISTQINKSQHCNTYKQIAF